MPHSCNLQVSATWHRYARFFAVCGFGWAGICTWAQTARIEPLQTLFYTPAERVQLVRDRSGAAPVAPVTQLRINGIVKREHGKSTAWINQRPLAEGQTQAPARRTRIAAQSVTLDGQGLRVGETIDLQSHVRTDVLPKGALAVKVAP